MSSRPLRRETGLRSGPRPSPEGRGPEGKGDTRRLFHSGLRVLALALLVVYCLWNVFWLGQGRLPPSLFLALTGLPAPTTGGARSVLQLCRGNWRESLRHNPLAVPLCLLFGLSLSWLVVQCLRRRRLSMPGWLGWAWAVVLGAAWVVQLARGPRDWWSPAP